MMNSKAMKKKILGAAIGDCVHVAGVMNFLRLAEEQGYDTHFLGPAVAPGDVVAAALEYDPDIIAVGYRLTPDSGERVIMDFGDQITKAGLSDKRLVFGGTEPVCRLAERLDLFEAVFSGITPLEEVIAFLRGSKRDQGRYVYPDRLVDRIEWKAPYPVIRHHFGLPDLEATIAGVETIAASGCLDVISLGVDQNTQEHFFRPDEMDDQQHGAGGVPVRSRAEFRRLYEASRRGNFPLIRCYSGTRDILKMAEVLHDELHNAWCAIPLTWYSILDGRSQRSLLDTIREAQQVLAWHGRQGIPVEMNESHHWSLRDSPDVVAAAMAFLAAYNAREMGVGNYLQQMMFNNPPGTSFAMDLAKMLAKLDLVEELQNDGFTVWRETRGGLSSYPADLSMAKGHLASTVMVQMAVRPHILHVVGFPEADHAASAEEVIESSQIARKVIENCLMGMPDMTLDAKVQARREKLRDETRLLLETIKQLAPSGVSDPWADPVTLTRAVEVGLIDAPHLRNNPTARGTVVTRMIEGAWYAVDPDTKVPFTEQQRIDHVWRDYEAMVGA